MKIRLLVLPAIILGLSGCSTMYYGAMEKLGVHKQNSTAILMSRISEGR